MQAPNFDEQFCQVCRQAPESAEHLFTLCAWTKNIWSDPSLHANTSPERITRIDKWIVENLTSRADQHSKALFAGALWQIWKCRNRAIFQGHQPNPNTHNPELKWKPPAAKEMKINVNCSWCELTKAGSIAGVCRNSAGTLTHGFAKPIFAPSVWVAEALALREAVLWVRNRRLARTGEDSQLQETDLHVLISLDNLSLTNSLLGLEEPPWPGRPIVADCREILAQLNGVSIIYEPQDTNKAAD